MDTDNYNIKGLSETLYHLVESISTLEEACNEYKQGQSELKHTGTDEAEIKKILATDHLKHGKITGLIMAFQIDITICLKHMDNSTCKYESSFLFNIGLMKMVEMAKKLLNIHQDIRHKLYYNCPSDSRKNIIFLVQEWNTKYKDWISKIRNNSTAHYDDNIIEYINCGYKNIDPTKNQECFSEFLNLLEYISKEISNINIE